MTLTDTWRTRLRAGLGIGLLAVAFATAWAIQGWRKDSDIDHLKAGIAVANQAAADARAERTQQVLKAERNARDAIQAITDKLTNERDAARHEKDTYIAGVRSGAIRLSVPVVAPVPAGASCTDTSTAGGAGQEARAELTPAAAEFLDDIASEGDDAIRQSNALIDAYNALREKLNVQAQEPAGLPAQGH
ncbi:lysis system i-spanin subunit Rz [Herbaspirillum huttiense]|uniref:Lysis system i-spanin subunit Rz n=2 Tax=Herbaspirillum huttiense TaxID=863372 RepID=A0AAJ2H615_9BURK|nr:lysis system i-spanin subunit Rz [Herbaspirillum huttiense]MDR9835004.1 lysis system i-spanin subunit Rz [Herbaspirillum huttiense]